MKRCLLFLVLSMLVVSADVQAESKPGNTDVFSEVKTSYGSPKEQQQEIDKIQHMEDVPGLEWLQMSVGDKQDQILASLYALNQSGVTIRKPANYYYDLVQEKLNANPNLYNTNLTDILISVVYEKEAGTRKALDKIRKKR